MEYGIISDQIHEDLETSLQRMKQKGYKYVELHKVFGKSIEECNNEEVVKIKQLLHKYDLKVCNIASTVFFLCPLYPHYQISSFNENFYCIQGDIDSHLKYLENACKIANSLECKTIRVFPFRYPDNEDIIVVGTEEDQIEIVKNLKKAVEVAKLYDVILVVENCPYSHLQNGMMTKRVVDKVNDQHLKLLWDPANSYRANKHKIPMEYQDVDLLKEYELIKEQVKHIHLKNYRYDPSYEKPFVHEALLNGDIDFEKLIADLDYDGVLSLEPEVSYQETLLSMEQLKNIM